VLWLVALLGAVLTWPRDLAAVAGLDPSWMLGLHWWAAGRVRVPVDFTYGPLGFLGWPTAWTRPTGAAAIGAAVALQVLLARLVLARLGRRALTPAGLALVWVVLVVVPAFGYLQDLLAIVLLLALGRLASGRAVRPAEPLAVGALVGLAVLAEPSLGAGVALVGGLPLLALARGWRSRLGAAAVAGLTAPVVVAVGWVALGHPAGRLLPWARASVELVRGYGAMAREVPQLLVGYVVAAVAAAVVVALLRGPRPHAAVARWVVGLYLLQAFQHGFLRHDLDHQVVFFGAVLTAAVAVGLPRAAERGARLPAAGLAVVAAFSLLTFVVHPRAVLPHPLALAADVRTVATGSGWRAAQARMTAQIGQADGLPADLVPLLTGGVQVDAAEVAVLAPLPGVTWRPVPVFQLYTAYTPALDALDAAALAGPDAPGTVLRHLDAGAIDGRYAFAEAPAYQVALACRYGEVAREGRWQVLRRLPASGCGPERPLGAASLAPGRAVAVPAPTQPGGMVIARLRLDTGLPAAAGRTLFKPLSTPTLTLDGTTYRYLPQLDGQPVVVTSPGWLPVGPGPLVAQRTLALATDVRGTVAFSEIDRTG
jgi:hypothetical protein